MAPTNNRYAEKWTYQRTLDRLFIIESHSRSEDCLYLGDALDITGLYDDVWRYWQRKWRNCHEIIQQMKQIMQHFEVKLFRKMVKKEIPERVAMFALKHHYGWGKEPVQNLGTPPDYSYVDQDLINERQQQYNAALDEQEAETAQHVSETKNTETQAPVKRVGHMTYTPTALLGADFKKKLSEYNQAHPERPVSRPATYLLGSPPIGLDAIIYDGGYFVTPDMLAEALDDK